METDELIAIVRRTHALDALREEGAMDRRDLEQELGVSKPTVHRFTRSLGEQGLLTRVDGAFTLTLAGEIIAEEVTHLHETIDGVQQLRRVIQWLPIEEFDFDLRRFHDADIILPECSNPLAPIREAAALLAPADRIRVVSSIYVPETFVALKRGVTENGLSVTCVYDQRVIDIIRTDEEATSHLHQLLAHGAVVTVHPGEIPFALGIADERVLLGAIDDRGAPQALIVTEDAVIREWAEEICGQYLHRAEPVTVDTDALAVAP